MFNEPEQNVKQFNLREDAIVADLGTGAGWYALAAASVARRGKVYAIDVQKDLLEKVKAEALARHLLNVETIWGDIERLGGTKLGDASVDAVIVASVFFQVPDKQGLVNEIDRILKPSGQVLVIDWKTALPGGLPPVPAAFLQDLFYAKGFALEREISAGANHYGLIFRKP